MWRSFSSAQKADPVAVSEMEPSVTGSIAKAGSFRGPALIVPAGIDAGLVSVALRGRGIFVEGAIPVPAAE
jgi:hypothetical protein